MYSHVKSITSSRSYISLNLPIVACFHHVKSKKNQHVSWQTLPLTTLRTFKAVNLLSKVFFFLKGYRATLMRSTSVGSESCGCKHVDKQGREVRDLYLCTTKRRGKKRRVHLHAHVISYQIKGVILSTFYHCFKVHLLLHQSLRDLSGLLEVHIIYKPVTK